ncbi:hypothetical protein HGRIS_014408 [Hohenbuehelia grisea]|uniref:Uncharacterized protein n=1 Tax=Hohenbuehelia grisea TaxID=104357 RepID=A0ABR3JTK2_9AGAR
MVESILYGFYLAAFGVAVYLHLHASPRTPQRTAMLFIGTIMLALSTVHVALGFYKLHQYAFDATPNSRVDLALAMIFNTNNLLADCLIAYRCHVMWQQNYVTILLVALVLGSATYGYVFPVSNISICLILVVNIFVPGLTAGRIWVVIREVRQLSISVKSRLYNSVLLIVIESGVVYSVSLVALLLSSNIHADPFGRRHSPLELPGVGPGFCIAYGIVAQTVGIVPMLIVIQVSVMRVQTSPATSVQSRIDFSPGPYKSRAHTTVQFPETAAKRSFGLSRCSSESCCSFSSKPLTVD